MKIFHFPLAKTMKHPYLLISFLFLVSLGIKAQTIINTSFEDYTTGNIHTQNKWKVTKGSGFVVENATYAYTPTKGVKFENTSSSLQIDHEAYSKTETGLGGDVFVDFRIKINAISTTAFSITGNDLTSNTRNFMIEFSPDGKIKVYNGSGGSSTIKPTYALNTWNRISFKISNASSKWQLALNGAVYQDLLSFREIKGGATTFDYHSITFAQAAGTSPAVSSCDVALDDLYIGSEPISDINFGSVTPEEPNEFTLTVNQPQNGTISLSPQPANGKYMEGAKVTASIDIQDLCKYRFANWTNDVSGTSSPVTFSITKNMTIGANIVENPVTGTVYQVKNYNELKAAIDAMSPGDMIELADGDYSGNGLTVTRSGCEQRPILIKAKNQGQANIKGKLSFTLKKVSYITFEGLNFNLDPVASIFKFEGSNNIRITKNEFRMQKLTDDQTSKWILISDVWDNTVCTSHHNRIDHNLFDGKSDGGAWVVIDGAHGTSPGDISKYDLIDHNHFRNNMPRVDNEKETIRIGVSDLTPCKAYCTVEYNLFENCDGDPEIVSVKSWDNTIRYNTFHGCLGTVSLRQGGNNTVEGNYFFGDGKMVDGNGCGGIRVYGEGHKIINNYFEGLTGEKWDAACTITNGDAAITSTSWSAHFVPTNVTFAFNTYVNNKSNIEIGFTNNGNYGKYPSNCLIANNIFIDDSAPIVKSYSTNALAGVSFSNNIMYPTGNSSIGVSLTDAQARQIDPLLVKTDCRTTGNDCTNKLPYEVFKLSPESPAIDASTGDFSYVVSDFEGQSRSGLKDIGADEYNNNPIIAGVIGAEHVGPNAIDFALKITTNNCNIQANNPIVDITAINQILRIFFEMENNSPVQTNIYDLTGKLLKNAIQNTQKGMNMIDISLIDLQKGIYIVEFITSDYKATKKVKI